jgi:protein-tyrosine kinase
MNTIERAGERLSATRQVHSPDALAGNGRNATTGEAVDANIESPAAQVKVHVPPSTVVNPDISLTSLDQGFLLSPEGGRSRTAEEFRIIKRPLLVNAFEKTSDGVKYPNLIMVTSSVQGEGKTFTSLNLAISITMEMDSTVLLIDADVARPGLSRRLDVQDRPGLIDRLVDETIDLSQILLKTDIPKLTVLSAGTAHKRSTELLASGSMRRLLAEVASRYPDRIVLFDSPPVLETTEASVLASLMGQVVIVVEHDSTAQGVVKEALAHFETTENVFLVLNKCKASLFSNQYGYGYGYRYGYGYGAYGDADGAQN